MNILIFFKKKNCGFQFTKKKKNSIFNKILDIYIIIYIQIKFIINSQYIKLI